MNVAVILTGHFREYQEVFDSFDKYILQPLQPDVFIHTWDNLGMTTSKWHYDTEQPLDVMDVLEKYQPRAFCVEDHKQAAVDTSKYTGVGVPVHNIVNMFRKARMGFEMLSKDSISLCEPYDLILKCRPDIMFEEPLPASEMADVDNSWALYVPDTNNLQVNDHLAFGRIMPVGYYCRLYEYINYYYDPDCTVPNTRKDKSPLHAESLLYKHLFNADWRPTVKTTKLKYHIPHKRRQ